MKTQKHKLGFKSKTIAELNPSEMSNVKGGTFSPIKDLIDVILTVTTDNDQGPDSGCVCPNK